MLLSKLDTFDQYSIIIGLESMARQGDNLVRFLTSQKAVKQRTGLKIQLTSRFRPGFPKTLALL